MSGAHRPNSSKLVRNERRKLIATTLNTVGLAVFGVGALQPVFSLRFTWPVMLFAVAACAILVSMNRAASWVLSGLEE